MLGLIGRHRKWIYAFLLAFLIGFLAVGWKNGQADVAAAKRDAAFHQRQIRVLPDNVQPPDPCQLLTPTDLAKVGAGGWRQDTPEWRLARYGDPSRKCDSHAAGMSVYVSTSRQAAENLRVGGQGIQKLSANFASAVATRDVWPAQGKDGTTQFFSVGRVKVLIEVDPDPPSARSAHLPLIFTVSLLKDDVSVDVSAVAARDTTPRLDAARAIAFILATKTGVPGW